MRFDAHQHFWRYDRTEYPWIKPEWPIRRDYLPDDLQPLLAKEGLDGSIAVQARQTVEESRWLLELADARSSIMGVVGWVDLRSEQASDQLALLAKHPKFVGVRHVVQDEEDDRFLMRPDFLLGLARLKEFALTYDLLIYPKQLPAAIEVVRQFSDQPFVLDHLAKPFIKDGILSPWREQMRELAKAPNVSCKVSGMVTEAAWGQWQPDNFRPYLDVVFEAFGEDRLMFGSDWPVCLLSGSYPRTLGIVADYLEQFSRGICDKVFGANAARFYGIPAP